MPEFFDSPIFSKLIDSYQGPEFEAEKERIYSSFATPQTGSKFENIMQPITPRGGAGEQIPQPNFNPALVQAMSMDEGLPIKPPEPERGFLSQAAHDIWTGVKQGVFSEAGMVDNVIGALVKTIDPKKFEEIGGVQVVSDLVSDVLSQPTPEDIHEGLKSMVFRGMGQAVPIILEMAFGTKGLGTAMTKVGLPTAVKLGARYGTPTLARQTMGLWKQAIPETAEWMGSRWLGPQMAAQATKEGAKGVLGLAGPAYFAGREAIPSLSESIIEGEGALPAIGKAVGRAAMGAGVGTALGLSHMLPGGLATRVPAMGGIFAGQTAVEGGDLQDIIASGLVGAALAGPEMIGAGIKYGKKGIEKIRKTAPHEGPESPTTVSTDVDTGESYRTDSAVVKAMRLAAIKRFSLDPDKANTLTQEDLQSLLRGKTKPDPAMQRSVAADHDQAAVNNAAAADAVSRDSIAQKKTKPEDFSASFASTKKDIYEIAKADRESNNPMLEYDQDGNIIIREDLLEKIALAKGVDIKNPDVWVSLKDMLEEPLGGERFKDIKIYVLKDTTPAGGLLGDVDMKKYGTGEGVKIDETGKITVENPDAAQREAESKMGLSMGPEDPVVAQIWGKLSSDEIGKLEPIEAALINGELTVTTAAEAITKAVGLNPAEATLLAQRLKDVNAPTPAGTPGAPESKFDKIDKQEREGRIVSEGDSDIMTEKSLKEGIDMPTKEARKAQGLIRKTLKLLVKINEDLEKAQKKFNSLAENTPAREEAKAKLYELTQARRQSSMVVQQLKEKLYGYVGLVGKGLPEEWKDLNEAKKLEALDKLVDETAQGRRGKKRAPSTIVEEKKKKEPTAKQKEASPTVTDPEEAIRLSQEALDDLTAEMQKLETLKKTSTDPTKIGEAQARQLVVIRIMKGIEDDLNTFARGEVPKTLMAKQMTDLKKAEAAYGEFDKERTADERKIAESEGVPTTIEADEKAAALAEIEAYNKEKLGSEFGVEPTGAEGVFKGKPFEQPGTPPPGSRGKPVLDNILDLVEKLRSKGYRRTNTYETIEAFANFVPEELERAKQIWKRGGPTPDQYLRLYVDRSDGSWEVKRAYDGKTINSSTQSTAQVSDLADMLGRIVRPASAGEKAKTTVKEMKTHYAPDGAYFTSFGQASATAEALNKRAAREGRQPSAVVDTVTIPKEFKGERDRVGYVVREAITESATDVNLAKILEPPKDKDKQVKIELTGPNGMTVEMFVRYDKAIDLAKLVSGTISQTELDKIKAYSKDAAIPKATPAPATKESAEVKPTEKPVEGGAAPKAVESLTTTPVKEGFGPEVVESTPNLPATTTPTAITPTTEKGRTVYVEKVTPQIQKIITDTFPDFRGKDVRISSKIPTRLDSYWDEGNKSEFTFYSPDTGKSRPVGTNHPFFEANKPRDLESLPSGVMLVERRMSGNKPDTLIIYANEKDLAGAEALSYRKAGITPEETVFLAATRGLKSSYMGSSRQSKSGLTVAQWEAAKESLIKKGMITKSGAITPKGRNEISDTDLDTARDMLNKSVEKGKLGSELGGLEPTGTEGIFKGRGEQPGTPPPGSRRNLTQEEIDALDRQKAEERKSREERRGARDPMASVSTKEDVESLVKAARKGSDERTAALNELDRSTAAVRDKMTAYLEERKRLQSAIDAKEPGHKIAIPRLGQVDAELRELIKTHNANLEAYRHLAGLEYGGSDIDIGTPRLEADILITNPLDGKPFGGSVISVGHENGVVYNFVQGPNNSIAETGQPATMGGKAWLKEHTRTRDGKTEKYLRLDGWSLENMPEEVQDRLLAIAIDKNMTGPDGRRVEKKSGVADEVWERRKDSDMNNLYGARLRRLLALRDIREGVKGETEINRMYEEAFKERDKLANKLKKNPNDAELVEQVLAQDTLVDSIKTMMQAEAERGPVGWTKEQRLKYLDEATKLNESIDQTLIDIDFDRAGGRIKYTDVARIVDIFGDPTRSKNPTVRRIATYGQQYEMAYRKAVLGYMKMIDSGIGHLVKNNPQKNKELMWHLHKVKPLGEDPAKVARENNGVLKDGVFVSTDPDVLKAADFHKMVFEDLAKRFELDKKGLYIQDYATIRYDLNKIWDFFRKPLERADEYHQLPDSVLGAVRPANWMDLKNIAERYKGKSWDQMDPDSQHFIKSHYLKWSGAFTEWDFLPRDLQQMIPKEAFVEYFKPRTAGENLKFALTDDYLSTAQRYLQVTLRGAMYNDFLAKANPLLRTLPHKTQPGTWGHLAQSYVERLGGYGKESFSDVKWNSLADSLNKVVGTNLVPYYLPAELVGQYREMLYRGALGPDTAFRNLTQTMFTWAEDGTLPLMKGLVKFVYGAVTKSPEYKKYAELRDLLEENWHTEMAALRKSDNAAWQRIKDANHRLTYLVLSPLRFTENVNKGIAYFSGLEKALKDGIDFKTAHLIGTRNAGSFPVTNLERMETEWMAWNKMGKSQYLYGKANTSPYLQSNIASAFWPFLSFPFKTIQMLMNGLKESWMGKEWAKLARFIALTGFLATAPYMLAETLGIDAYAVWGKGALPIDVMPMWYNTMRDMYTGAGGSDTDFMSKELARKRVKESLMMLIIPQYRWLRKTGAPYELGITDINGAWQRINDKYVRWGRTQSPMTDTNMFSEVMNLFGVPLQDRREGREWMREAKDASAEYTYTKSKIVRRVIELQDQGRSQAAHNAMEMAKSQGYRITGEDLSSAKRKREIDAFTLQAKGMPKHMQGEWRKKAEQMKKRMINKGQRSMWGGQREEEEE